MYHKIKTIYTAYTNVQKKRPCLSSQNMHIHILFHLKYLLVQVHKPTKDLLKLSALAGCVLDTYSKLVLEEEEE